MRTAALSVGLAMGVLAFATAMTESKAKDDKGTVVEIDGLRSKTPADWKEEAVANKMRYMQFKLPKAKGDKDDAELVIFKGLGGTAKQNLERWKAQFAPPKGKTIDEASKVEELKVGDRPV